MSDPKIVRLDPTDWRKFLSEDPEDNAVECELLTLEQIIERYNPTDEEIENLKKAFNEADD